MTKKIVALVIAVAMVLSLTAAAFAADQINEGKTSDAPTLADKDDVGVAGTWVAKDTKIVQNRTINIKKELISINATSTSVFAPAFTYVYTVTPVSGSSDTVTDETSDHVSGAAVTAPVQAGKTEKLTVNGGEAGDTDSAVGTLEFTNTTPLTTSTSAEAEGATNAYDVTLDFSKVEFTQPGVYRYQIAETLAESKTYAQIDIEDGGTNTLYLDVYVDGDFNIYGYVCMAENGSVTPDNADTVKTNGFVEDSHGADKYYTYDLVVSKQVENDKYGEGHAFPFTITFSDAADGFDTTFAITEDVSDGSTGINPTAGVPTWTGTAKVKEGAPITYKGIPAGVNVNIYETNDMFGVTYAVSSKVNGTEKSTNANLAYEGQSTAVDVETSATTAVTAEQEVEITNSLLLISPTGVVFRVAPYVLILAGGIALLLISRRRKSASAEE